MTNPYPILDPSLSSFAQRRGSCALAVMIKAPRAGASKTRLVPPLTHTEAAALSVCFLRDITANVSSVSDGVKAEGIAVYTPVGAESELNELLPESFSLLAQRGETLGERLIYATEDLLKLGYDSLCLMNSDSPTLPRALLRRAVKSLARDGDRVVLGGTDDGGYYLIGLKRPHRRLFEDINWSTSEVFAQTIQRAAEINLEVERLPAWYDVDDEATLRRLCDEVLSEPDGRVNQKNLIAYEAPHTRRFLMQLNRAQR